MASQRKLDALLFELQAAGSPLHQAKILARAWRTLRELSPTDRRLLARHVGFKGAEELLEGLASKRGTAAPALVLEALAAARSADSDAISDILDGLHGSPVDEQEDAQAPELSVTPEPVVIEGAPAADEDHREDADDVDAALGELRAVQSVAGGAVDQVRRESSSNEAGQRGVSRDPRGSAEDRAASIDRGEVEGGGDVGDPDRNGAAVEAPPTPATKLSPPVLTPPAVMRPVPVDWSRWHAVETSRMAPSPKPPPGPPEEHALPPFDARAVLGALGAQNSVISQLRVLRRELEGFMGSSVDTLLQVLEVFPDGWARRRALCAMLEAGLPADSGDAIALVASLGRDSDRGWCLGILARDGRLWGSLLEQALELLGSRGVRRRVEAATRRPSGAPGNFGV
jgi:hypothetical protein